MHNWCLEVWGDYACFTRPEMKVERVSYDVMTPSAARAIFEAILWKPAIRWNVTKIEVVNEIRWVSVRRNEVGKVISQPSEMQMAEGKISTMGFFIEDERQQRAGLFLKDVKYRIHAYFDYIPLSERKKNSAISPEFWADEGEKRDASYAPETEAKYAAMFERRAKKGQCFHRPYLGCREFACDFRLIQKPEEETFNTIHESRELGYMLYDMDFESDPCPQPLFFKAKLENGVLITDRRLVEVRG
jgi:CRISPR-associated protein Cas5d